MSNPEINKKGDGFNRLFFITTMFFNMSLTLVARIYLLLGVGVGPIGLAIWFPGFSEKWVCLKMREKNNKHIESTQFIATVQRRLVTPKGSDCKGILPKMSETLRLRIYNNLPRLNVLPRKLTCPGKMVGRCISYWNSPLFRGHVSFQGCKLVDLCRKVWLFRCPDSRFCFTFSPVWWFGVFSDVACNS